MLKGQVWIETVIYTLIGLSVMGIILTLAVPKINEIKDKTILDQSIDMLNVIDGKIEEIKYVSGNSRTVDVSIKRGNLIIDGNNDVIEFLLEDSKAVYSEPGKTINIGNIKVTTENNGKVNIVSLKLEYSLNITYEGQDKFKTIQPAPTPYKLVVKNNGSVNEKTNIDFS